MKQHLGFLIDAINCTVTPVKVGDYKDIQKIVGCDLFCVGAYIGENGDTLYVDDEGLINGTEHCFFFDGKLLMGNGLVLGSNENTGNSRDVRLSLDELTARVKFPHSCFRLDPAVREKMCEWTITTF